MKQIVFIEDGSLSNEDIKRLQEMGFQTFVYGQGSAMPAIRIFEDNPHIN